MARTLNPSARVVQWGVVLLPVVMLLVLGWQRRWMSDDGFIHLRVVDQLLAGNGPVFNPGERVEASTSPLWVGLLAGVAVVPGLALPWKAVLLGIALSAAGLLAAQRAGMLLATRGRSSRGVVVPVGAFAVAALPPFWDFASSGLETGLVFAWLGGATWWSTYRCTSERPPGRRAEVLGSGLVGLGWLIRPDLVVFTLAFATLVVASVWRDSARRRRLGVVTAMVALPVAYQVFRMGYYAMVVPNTALAKEAGRPQWAQGWAYLRDLVAPYDLWLPGLLLLGVLALVVHGDVRRGDRRAVAARLAPAAAAVAHGLYVQRAGGDFMHGRLLLPSFFGLFASLGVWVSADDLRAAFTARRYVSRALLTAGATAVVLLWVMVCTVALRRGQFATDLLDKTETAPRGALIIDERLFYSHLWHMPHPVRPDGRFGADHPRAGLGRGEAVLTPPGDPSRLTLTLRPGFPSRTAHAGIAVGVPSYAWGTDVYVLDLMSLAQPVGSHIEETVGRRPGHQKPVPLPWIVADVTEASAAEPRDVAAARRALECGDLGRYLDDIREPLTPKRFATNLLDSVGNTLFRVERDATKAAAQLCD